tara:strand:+ start:13563 stop:15629 length:2067 start_codon:yes stop_codon:yes gene_type:complete
MIATRNSFVALLPLTFLRVIAELILNFPWLYYQQSMDHWLGSDWREPLRQIIDNSFTLFGLLLAAIVSAQLVFRLPSLTKQRQIAPPLMVALSAVINYLIITVSLPNVSPVEFSAEIIIIGIVIGLFSAELMLWAAKQSYLDWLNLPVDSDTTFYHAMRLSPSIILNGLVFFSIGMLLSSTPEFPEVTRWIIDWAQSDGNGTWILSTFVVLVNQLFWFIGLHGSVFLQGAADGALFAASTVAGFESNLALPTMLSNFVLIGGSGATLGLLIAIFIVTRRGSQNKIAKISIIPSLFNINDILIYGLPIVFNPFYLIPFVLIPLLLMLISLLALQFGFITIYETAVVSWTTPPLLSGWLLTESWRGVALQILLIELSTVCYIPFVRKAEEKRHQHAMEAFQLTTDTIIKVGNTKQKIVTRQDKVGMIARDLAVDMQNAIRQNSLTLVYQPKHDRQGHIVGVEALLRWTHPRYGFISPIVIIAVAEDSELIHHLGRWVIKQACACKARWNTAGYKALTVAVNISPLQLTDKDLPFYITKYINDYGIEAEELELEITESSEIPDTNLTDLILQQLVETGVHLAMDDFGMGYSSLLYMRRFQVNAIKIDGSITRDVLVNDTNADIVRTICSLGKAQKVHVVAEYVETKEQREVLSEMGCDIFQGYYHSPPIAETDCQDYFQLHNGLVQGKLSI